MMGVWGTATTVFKYSQGEKKTKKIKKKKNTGGCPRGNKNKKTLRKGNFDRGGPGKKFRGDRVEPPTCVLVNQTQLKKKRGGA